MTDNPSADPRVGALYDTIDPDRSDLGVYVAMVEELGATSLLDLGRGTLRAGRFALRSGGRLVFETRDPVNQAWRDWDTEHANGHLVRSDGYTIETWEDVVDVDLPRVTFHTTIRLATTGETLRAESELRFRTKDEVLRSLDDTGLRLEDIRHAPDRPGRQLGFVASVAPARAPRASATRLWGSES